MSLEIYDLECLCNLFTYTGYVPFEDKYYQFVICSWRNDYVELVNHLKRDKLIQIGFNNDSFDYPVEHHILNHFSDYQTKPGREIAQLLYKKAQEIIKQEFSIISDKNKFIPQLDLYKIWHYSNPARKSSLKDLEICMRMKNVEEMPFQHTHWCSPGDEIKVLEYNQNDVLATYKFWLTTLGKTEYSIYKGKDKIKLRQDISKKFNVNVMNLGDVPMGYELILKLYSRAINENPYTVKKWRTPRTSIKLADCIPSWCNIKSKEFNQFLDMIKNTTIRGEKGEFSYSVIFHGIKFDFGLGGTHGSAKGVFESNSEYMIVDFDVSSLYPTLAKSLKLFPQHLGPIFMDLYEDFIEKRINEKHKPKEERDNALIEGYKLILNGA